MVFPTDIILCMRGACAATTREVCTMSGIHEGPIDYLDLLASGEIDPDDITAALGDIPDHELKPQPSAARHDPGEIPPPSPEFLTVISGGQE